MAEKVEALQSEDFSPTSNAEGIFDSTSNIADSEGDHRRNGEPNGSGIGKKDVDRYGFFGGNQYTEPGCETKTPVEVMRKRELKWIGMLENWEKWMSKRFKKVKERCRKGIPPSIRGRAWQYLSGSKFLMEQNAGVFQRYLQLPGNERCIDDIRKDVNRQYPLHEIFSSENGLGQEDLFSVLKAYSIHNPLVGYVQAQAPIAAVLLMHMPAEQAFWCFVSICDKYLPGYYNPGLEAIQIDLEVLYGLLKKISPFTYKHLMKYGMEPAFVMFERFMCVYARNLPWSSVLRVWDVFLCEGVKVLFRVGLVLLKGAFDQPEHQLSQCRDHCETMQALRHYERHLNEDSLISECLRLPITERDMEKEHQVQLTKWKASQQTAAKTRIEAKKQLSAMKKKAVASPSSSADS